MRSLAAFGRQIAEDGRDLALGAVRLLRSRHGAPTLLAVGAAAALGIAAPVAVHRATHQVTAGVMGAGAALADIEPKAITAVAAVADSAATGQERHLGFDTSQYPGDAAMVAWRRSGSPYEWVGYYLPAPCHKDASWAGKRQKLLDMGWGLAVVYVGQQTWGKAIPATPAPVAKTTSATRATKSTASHRGRSASRSKSRSRSSASRKRHSPKPVFRTTTHQPAASANGNCGASFVNAAQGRLDADDAIAKTAAEGFPKGTVIFLDIERMETVPPAMRDYYKSWTARVLEDGRYRPGYYAHTHNAELVYADVKDVFEAAGNTSEPAFWVAGTRDFSPEKKPTDVGHAFAAVWQGLLDVVQTHNGVRLPIDVNVSGSASPSAVD